MDQSHEARILRNDFRDRGVGCSPGKRSVYGALLVVDGSVAPSADESRSSPKVDRTRHARCSSCVGLITRTLSPAVVSLRACFCTQAPSHRSRMMRWLRFSSAAITRRSASACVGPRLRGLSEGPKFVPVVRSSSGSVTSVAPSLGPCSKKRALHITRNTVGGRPSNKPLKLTAERVGATIRGAGQGSPGWVAHGKLHAGRSLAARRWAARRIPCMDAV